MFEYANIVFHIFTLCGNEFVTQLFIVSLLFLSFQKRKLFWVWFPLSWGVIIALQWLLPLPPPLGYLEVAALLFALVFACFECNISQAVFLSVSIYCVQFIISTFSYSLVFLIIYLTGTYENFKYYYVIMPVVMAAIMACVYFIALRKWAMQPMVEMGSLLVLYSVTAFLIVAIFLSHYGNETVKYSAEGTLYIRLISCMFGVAILVICFMNVQSKNLELENSVLQQMLKKDEQYYKQAKLSHEKIQIKYHDLKKREHQGIVDYAEMEEIEEDREILSSTYYTGNRALDIIVSEKALMCVHKNIRFICTADGEALSFMKSYHIYSLFGNALDNAIESLKPLQDEALRELDVSVALRGDMAVISVSNYIAVSPVIKADGLPETTKQDKEEHGYGVKSMRNIVELYGGKISFSAKDNVFTVLAIIPVPPAKETVK